VSLAVFGSLAGGVVTALLFGLVAGVGARAAALQRPNAPGGRLSPWTAGIAAALVAAGAGAALAGLAPRTVPHWPQFPFASLAVPVGGAVLQGLAVLTASAVGLFLLDVLTRLTDGWQRRRWSVPVIFGAVTMALALVAAPNPVAAAIGGVAAGLVTAILVLGLLRFDYRAVPSYCATGIVLDLVEGAPARGTVADWGYVAVAAVVAMLVAWAATHYLGRARDAAIAAE
jgi:hypothetical protein